MTVVADTSRSVAAFRPEAVERFRFTDLRVDAESGVVELCYALDDTVSFCERVELGSRLVDDDRLDAGFIRVARLLHLAAGTSYYKAAMCPRLVVETGPLSAIEREFCLDLYDKGLRELAWHNGLPLERRITIDAPELLQGSTEATARSSMAFPPARLGVPIGGGKDSAVVVEALRSQDPVLVSVNGHPAARRVAEAAGLALTVVRRRIDPVLFELNAAGARNGHVPITAIVSLISVAAGFRVGYDTTVMALEGSADEPTRTVAGDDPGEPAVTVNHQWSKSSEFEASLARVLAASVGTGVHYRSALRGVGELAIARCFAALPQYHRAFLSCNRAFTRCGSDRWCGQCPKCRFVFLALATAMDPDQLVPIFGRDLLGDPEQVDGFRDLLEEDRKPFECVGTRAESLVAFDRLAHRGPWRHAAVVQALAPVVTRLRSRADPGAPGGAAPGSTSGGAGASRRALAGAADEPDEPDEPDDPASRLLDEVDAPEAAGVEDDPASRLLDEVRATVGCDLPTEGSRREKIGPVAGAGR